MYLVAEAERRVDRGRQIVAQQRALVAKIGETVPIAVELLRAYETTLALLESALANRRQHEPGAGSTSPAQDHQAQRRDIARVMEILRGGGYDCELVQDTLH